MNTDKSYSATSSELKNYIDRCIRVNNEINEMNEARKELFQEIKSKGYDLKVIKTIIREQENPRIAEERIEFEALYDMYMSAIMGKSK